MFELTVLQAVLSFNPIFQFKNNFTNILHEEMTFLLVKINFFKCVIGILACQFNFLLCGKINVTC